MYNVDMRTEQGLDTQTYIVLVICSVLYIRTIGRTFLYKTRFVGGVEFTSQRSFSILQSILNYFTQADGKV